MNRGVDLAKIKRLRKAKHISQEEMALILGYKTATGYNYLESGRCAIDIDKLMLIAKTLGLASIEDLLLYHSPTEMVISNDEQSAPSENLPDTKTAA